MQAKTPEVLTALESLKADGDPRVLDAVDEALATLASK
jgi:hypothetical protein